MPLWFANVWVRRAAVVLAVGFVLLGARQHFINEGKRQGWDNAGQATAGDLQKQSAVDRADTASRLEAIERAIEASNMRADADRLLIVELARQRAAVPQQVAGMTSQQVQEQINRYLGKSADAGPLTEQDDRAVLTCFKQLDLCTKQTEAAASEAQELRAASDKSEEKYSELSGYTTRLEQNYTMLFNATAKPRRSPKCLWLWRCTRPHVDVPDPKVLKHAVKTTEG